MEFILGWQLQIYWFVKNFVLVESPGHIMNSFNQSPTDIHIWLSTTYIFVWHTTLMLNSPSRLEDIFRLPRAASLCMVASYFLTLYTFLVLREFGWYVLFGIDRAVFNQESPCWLTSGIRMSDSSNRSVFNLTLYSSHLVIPSEPLTLKWTKGKPVYILWILKIENFATNRYLKWQRLVHVSERYVSVYMSWYFSWMI